MKHLIFNYEKLRPLSYSDTDVFLVCFSLVHPETLENAVNMWVLEIIEHCPNAHYILVGTNQKLRDEFSKNEEEYRSKGYEPISTEKGNEAKSSILAYDYKECECTTNFNVKEVFDVAVKAGLTEKKSITKRNLLRIGIFGGKLSGKHDVAIKYIHGEFGKKIIPINSDQDFTKFIEVHNRIIELTVNANQKDFKNVHAIILMFNVSNEKSIDDLKSQVNKSDILKHKDIPRILVANFIENKEEDYEEIEKLCDDFACDFFEMNSNSYDDINDLFHYLTNKIPKGIIKRIIGKKNRRRRKKKAQ